MPLLRITVDLFSGRPNPVLELSGKTARKARALLKSAVKRESKPLPVPTLGYRRLLIETLEGRSRPPVRSTDAELSLIHI